MPLTETEHRLGHPADLDAEEGARDRREMIAAMDRFIVRYYGERCSPVQGGCPCCAIWAARDVFSATTFE